jgi:hypothetical protein
MTYDKSVPEMSSDFCERVVAKSWDVKQRRPFMLRTVVEKPWAIFPVRVNWAVMTMAVVFMVGVFIGTQSYITTFSDTVDISELTEI